MMLEPTAQTSSGPKPHAALNDAVLPSETTRQSLPSRLRMVPSQPPTAHVALGVPHSPISGACDGKVTGDHALPLQWMAVPSALMAHASSAVVPHTEVSS